MEEVKVVSTRLPSEQIRRLKAAAAKQGRKMESVFAEAIADWLRKKKEA